MKLTTKKAQKALKAFKNGLSIVLTLIILVNAIQPVQVRAASQDVSASAETAQVEVLDNAQPEKPVETVQNVLLDVCQSHGYGEACAKHLLGMVMQESVGLATAVGDRGYSHGWFQIHKFYNPEVTRDCAQDLECSAEWTLTRLEKKGYAKRPQWAIWCHNGCGISKSYVPNVLRKGEANWSTPLPVITADEQRAIAAAKKLALK